MELDALDPRLAELTTPAPDALEASFPKRIDFYGFGVAELTKRPSAISECAAAPFLVAFQVSGEIRGAIVVAFDREPFAPAPGFDDIESAISGWSELANVLAAKLASELADRDTSHVMISPPDAAFGSDPRLRYMRRALLSGGSKGSVSKVYDYKGDRPMTIRMAFLPAFPGGNT